MDNPFRYGDIVEGEYFTNRTAELADLMLDMRSGQNVILISPRRFGKTSLVRKAASALRDEGLLVAELNARRKQYEYYRNKLLTFKEKEDN